MKALDIAAAKAKAGERLNLEDALALYEQANLLDLGAWARAAKERISGKEVYYNVNRHVNLSNVCTAGCPLCAFSCKKGDKQGFLLSQEDVLDLVERAVAEAPDLSEVHMVSSLHPDQPFSYYLEVVRAVKTKWPQLHIKAFTPVEIWHFAKLSGLSFREVLRQLQEAGLDSLPGGGAEILDDSVRQRICPDKANSAEWIEIIRTAHQMGIPTNATMLYGHVETIEQRLRHLLTLRDIQDETGGFQAFVSFPFHPANTGFSELQRASSWEDLKMIALARLILDNVEHIKSFWMMLTMPVAQLSLAFGVDDMDGTVMEEKIIHAAGSTTRKGITKAELCGIIRETGYIPVERDTFYHPCRDGRNEHE